MSDFETREPDVTEVLTSTRDTARGGTLVCKLAKVERYDPATRKADVSPVVKEWRYDEADAKVEEALPIIPNVPVQFPSAGGLSITFPIPKGTTGICIFSDVGLDQWLAVGGTVGAGSERRHSLADAIFIPGVNPFNAGQAGAGGSAIEIGTTGACTEGAALGTSLKNWIDKHAHAVACPPGGGNVLSFPPSSDPAGTLNPSTPPSKTVKVSP